MHAFSTITSYALYSVLSTTVLNTTRRYKTATEPELKVDETTTAPPTLPPTQFYLTPPPPALPTLAQPGGPSVTVKKILLGRGFPTLRPATAVTVLSKYSREGKILLAVWIVTGGILTTLLTVILVGWTTTKSKFYTYFL